MEKQYQILDDRVSLKELNLLLKLVYIQAHIRKHLD